jgi:hypothetical protein
MQDGGESKDKAYLTWIITGWARYGTNCVWLQRGRGIPSPAPFSPKLDAGDRRSLCHPLTVKFVSPICILFEELLMSAWFYFPLLLPDRNICHATQAQFVRVNSFTLSRTSITVKRKTSFLYIGDSPCLNFCQFFWKNLKGSDDGV